MYSAYHPLGSVTRDLQGASPATALDLALPLWPSWIVPYSAVFFLGFLPVFVIREPRLFRRMALAYIVLELVALACFFWIPVEMTHAPDQVAVTSFTTWGLALTYWLDTPANCFPSLHVATGLLAALTTARVDRRLGFLAGGLSLVISASAVLVKQHYLVDVVGGACLAWGVHRVFVDPLDLSGVPLERLRLPRWWAHVPWVAWLLTLAGFYGMYCTGWVPPLG